MIDELLDSFESIELPEQPFDSDPLIGDETDFLPVHTESFVNTDDFNFLQSTYNTEDYVNTNPINEVSEISFNGLHNPSEIGMADNTPFDLQTDNLQVENSFLTVDNSQIEVDNRVVSIEDRSVGIEENDLRADIEHSQPSFTGYDESRIKEISKLTKELNEGELQIKKDAHTVELDNTIHKGATTDDGRSYRIEQLDKLINKVEKIRTELEIKTGRYYPKNY